MSSSSKVGAPLLSPPPCCSAGLSFTGPAPCTSSPLLATPSSSSSCSGVVQTRLVPCWEALVPSGGAFALSSPLSQSRYKMSLCNFFYKGRCRNGPSCRFAHGLAELRGPLPNRKNPQPSKVWDEEEGMSADPAELDEDFSRQEHDHKLEDFSRSISSTPNNNGSSGIRMSSEETPKKGNPCCAETTLAGGFTSSPSRVMVSSTHSSRELLRSFLDCYQDTKLSHSLSPLSGGRYESLSPSVCSTLSPPDLEVGFSPLGCVMVLPGVSSSSCFSPVGQQHSVAALASDASPSTTVAKESEDSAVRLLTLLSAQELVALQHLLDSNAQQEEQESCALRQQQQPATMTVDEGAGGRTGRCACFCGLEDAKQGLVHGGGYGGKRFSGGHFGSTPTAATSKSAGRFFSAPQDVDFANVRSPRQPSSSGPRRPQPQLSFLHACLTSAATTPTEGPR
eukprot:GHVS01064200.1.p1 GENE.GHVS01064200.1~~GHVS01064200.1.p1  ORF type:complete len:451 (-),score=107.34 GHVS01064200.1:1376-2728(-)